MRDRVRGQRAVAFGGLVVLAVAVATLDLVPRERVLSVAGGAQQMVMVLPVHRRYDYHCHRRRGYRRWCHQGARGRRDDGLDGDDLDGGGLDGRSGGRPPATARRRQVPRWFRRRHRPRSTPTWPRPYPAAPRRYRSI